MGLRARKSITLMKGVKLNLNKGSVGLSVGTKGLRYSVNSKGRKTVSAGIPGTGISYVESVNSKKTKKGKKTNKTMKPVVCPKCKSININIKFGEVEVKKKRSLLVDLLMICCTFGLWILWMIFRKKKEKVQGRICTCVECGHSWNMR